MSEVTLIRLERMKNRIDFLNTARAQYYRATGFLLQARHRNDNNPIARVGFTCSKKLGNAVARNRAKRRLREIARLELPTYGKPGWDYVLIGKAHVTAKRDFINLRFDLRNALGKIHP